ncbi:MAG: hypothetical protein MUC38_02985 [Cyclobacteriaceae bacterium]|nr:hypothetical protein [Cyclobacteriaceae bacterium]
MHEPAYSPHRASSAETPEVTITLQHLHNQFEHFVFDLDLAYQGGGTLWVAPNDHVSYYASSKPFPTHDRAHDIHAQSYKHSRLAAKRLYARDPSAVVRLVDQRLKKRATAQTVFALIGVGLAVYDALKDGEDNRQETWTYADARKAAAREAAVAGAMVASDLAGASAQKAAEEAHHLPHEVFPPVALAPGESQRGKVFLPIETNYRFMRVVVSLPPGDYVFDFKREGTQR